VTGVIGLASLERAIGEKFPGCHRRAQRRRSSRRVRGAKSAKGDNQCLSKRKGRTRSPRQWPCAGRR
jgi:hypothetical protein